MRSRVFSLFALSALLALVPSAACSSDDDPAPVELRGPGAQVRVSLAPFGIAILGPDGSEVLKTTASEDASPYGAVAATRDDGPDNVKLIPGWDGYVPDEKPWAHAGRAKVTARSATSASFDVEAGGGGITVDVAIDGAKVSIKTSAHGTSKEALDPTSPWNKTTLSFALRPDEHFFGLGERYATVDHRGVSMYSWAEEGGTGLGENTPEGPDNPSPNGPSMTYFPVPFFMSSAGYAVHLATTYRTETHFGSERPDAWRVAANVDSFETVIYLHDDPLASLDDFTRETGRPMVPATWTFGPIRRVSYDNTVDGEPEWKKIREAHIPTTSLDDAVHLLPARSEVGREDVLKNWTTTAHQWGYKVMAYNNPYISTSKASAAGDLAYGKDHGLLALAADGSIGETFFISGEPQTLATIDLTNPDAVAWFQDLLRRSLALGYDGWMHDFGEYVRRPWKFHDGRDGQAVHDQFPVLSAKAAHELLEKERPDDYVFYVRSGYTGQQQYAPAVWGGDAEATFDETQGMPSALRGGLNLGMSGVAVWGSDVSGYKCLTDFPNDKEVYLRWAELGAVSPFMVEENACANPLGNRTKWKIWNDDETIQVYAAMSRIHTRLAPYWEVLVRQAHATGVPITRHPFLYYPHEPEVWAIDSSFFLGPSLFASPVVRRGARNKDTWLPPGKWVDFDDHTVYEGGKHVVLPAPLDKLPLLVKDGGIVPLLDASIDTLAPATESSVVTPEQVKDRLDVVVALSAGKDATITLADGTVLTAKRSAAPGAPSALAQVTPDKVAMCDGQPADQGCVVTTAEGGVSRVRLTTPLAAASTIAHEDLELSTTGPSARRVRWDVSRIP